MRQAGLIIAALLLIGMACGPDPNAQLPEDIVNLSGGGGTGGGSGPEGVGGTRPASGGATGSSGGIRGTGGTGATAGIGAAGGVTGQGGMTSTGGKGGGGGGLTGVCPKTPGSGGTGGASGTLAKGALSSYTFGYGTEPCTPTRDVSGGRVDKLGTAKACIRTADDFTDWNCGGMGDRTIKINGKTAKCGDKPPAKLGSFYYFDISAGTSASDTFGWFCASPSCSGNHPVPECGHYPPWVSCGTAEPCADNGAPDAAVGYDGAGP